MAASGQREWKLERTEPEEFHTIESMEQHL